MCNPDPVISWFCVLLSLCTNVDLQFWLYILCELLAPHSTGFTSCVHSWICTILAALCLTFLALWTLRFTGCVHSKVCTLLAIPAVCTSSSVNPYTCVLKPLFSLAAVLAQLYELLALCTPDSVHSSLHWLCETLGLFILGSVQFSLHWLCSGSLHF